MIALYENCSIKIDIGNYIIFIYNKMTVFTTIATKQNTWAGHFIIDSLKGSGKELVLRTAAFATTSRIRGRRQGSDYEIFGNFYDANMKGVLELMS